jgi:hypothetical protein
MGVSLRQQVRFRNDVKAIGRTGVKLVKHSGYLTRGRPGGLTPRGVIVHHDASARGASDGILSLVIRGRSDLPGPLYNFWIGVDGRVHVIAAGRCNHAGRGYAKWTGRDGGNGNAYGICLDLTTGEAMSKRQRDALDNVTAALLARRGRKAARMVGHKEYSSEGKVDPAISMPRARRRVRKRIDVLRSRGGYFHKRWIKTRRKRGQAIT